MERNLYPPQVEFALRTMRKAETAMQELERQKKDNDRKIREGLAASMAKGKKKKKTKKPSADNAHQAAADNLMMNLDRPPMKLRSLQELKKIAGEYYSFAKGQRGLHAGDDKIGKPRPIFKGLVAEIKQMVLDQTIDEPVVALLNLTVSPPPKTLRPLTARHTLAPADTFPALREFPTVRPKSASNAVIKQRLEKKEAMLVQKERQLIEKINERDNREANRFLLFQREQRQRAFLVLMTFLRHQQICMQQLEELKVKKSLKSKTKNSSRQLWAVQVIALWWAKAAIIKRLRRKPEVLHRITSLFVRLKHNRLQRQRHNAVGFIKRFITDACRLSDKKVQINRYRNKIIKLQRWVRQWIKVQEARIYLLWVYCEKMGRLRMLKHKKTRASAEKSALETMMALQGSVMKYLTTVRGKITAMHYHYEQNRHLWCTDEEQVSAEDASNKNNITSHGNSKPPHGAKKISRTRAWIKNMLALPHSAEKLRHLRLLLKSQRRRHQLVLLETQTLLKRAERQVNASALKLFLKHPDKHDGIDKVFEIVDKSGKVFSVSAIQRPVFLLLTRGAIAHIENLPDAWFGVT